VPSSFPRITPLAAYMAVSLQTVAASVFFVNTVSRELCNALNLEPKTNVGNGLLIFSPRQTPFTSPHMLRQSNVEQRRGSATNLCDPDHIQFQFVFKLRSDITACQ
jgi:hypothetical protein